MKQGSTLVRLLVVDDDPLVRVGIQLLFRALPEVIIVAVAQDATEAIHLLGRIRVDTVLMDIRMPRVSGFAATSAIKSRYPGLRVILISSAIGEELSTHARNAGADDYVPKSATLEQFREALLIKSGVSNHEIISNLSARELVVAYRVADGSTNSEIALDLRLSINTVKTYVSRAMAKLNVSNRVQLSMALRARSKSD